MLPITIGLTKEPGPEGLDKMATLVNTQLLFNNLTKKKLLFNKYELFISLKRRPDHDQKKKKRRPDL